LLVRPWHLSMGRACCRSCCLDSWLACACVAPCLCVRGMSAWGARVAVRAVLLLTLLQPTITVLNADKSGPKESAQAFFSARFTLRAATDFGHSMHGFHAGKKDKTNTWFGAALVAAMKHTEILGSGTTFMECVELWHKCTKEQVRPNIMLRQELPC